MQDLRCKHEYLNNVQRWLMITGNDESDKHQDARDRRDWCLIDRLYIKQGISYSVERL